MYLRLLILYLCCWVPLSGIPITLEHAVTPNEVNWGLMGRKTLPPDHGMTFTFPDHSKANVWMFNCYIDLSIAFLDKNSTIVELHELKAYPEKMDPRRPVKNVSEFKFYSNSDPIIRFFRQKSVVSRQDVKYMIEMPKDWFPSHGVHVGDKIYWDKSSPKGEVVIR